MLKTKIVCTIGPASRSPEMLRALIKAGMDVARLNFSHGDLAFHAENVERIRAASAEVGKPVAILMDLQGPKLRVGTMQEGGVPLEEGQEIILTTRHIIGHPGEIPVQYPKLPQIVEPGDRILIDDGLLEVQVLSVYEEDIRCLVITGGLLETNKGMNLPRVPRDIPAITEKDIEDLAFIHEHQADWIALSFVRQAEEVSKLKELILERSPLGEPIPVIAKIEKPEAVENIDEIIAVSDGIMVARGDLGIETSPEEVPLTQKMIIKKCNMAGVPVITATQMLESMIRNPRPTRAEASDVANAILDGTDAIMLSGETAVGKYPLESVATMVRIAARAEEEIRRSGARRSVTEPRKCGIAEAVAHASCETARDLNAAAIITPTVSGYTARMVSSFRPEAPIIAVTPSPMVQRRLALYWGVYPLLAKRTDNTDEMIADAVRTALEHGLVKPGDLLVITGGAAGSAPGTTNLIRVHVVEKVLGQGQGFGTAVVTGRVRIVTEETAASTAIHPGDIIVTECTTRLFVPLVRKAAGVITELGGESCHAALLALELGVPTIVGVENALSILKEGQEITMDTRRGLVYEGQVSVS